MPTVSVDFTKKVRAMKPMHGVDNGPLTCNFTMDARPLFQEAGLPFSRLHDTEYPFGSGEFVDIGCIFKCFDNDVDDPASYNFALTDAYIAAIRECGTKVIYRLGSSIEHQEIKVHIYPPKDMLKWAKICEHIIRHYNEGWANGYHFDIEYWEIWNEPNHMLDKKMWLGTVEQFAELYTTAATYLKEKFPKLKIGGPAFSNPDSDFVRQFFPALTKNGAHPPMDFYSYHGYIDTVEKAVARIESAENILAMYGYTGAEHIFDEWNYVKSWSDVGESYAVIHSEKGAAFDGAVLAALQNTACDIACYYDAQMKFASSWCGLFTASNKGRRNGGATLCAPAKGFYAFKAFNTLYQLGTQVQLDCDDKRLYGLAARSKDGKKAAFMLSSFADIAEPLEDKEVTFTLKGVDGKKATVYLCDAEHDLEKTAILPAGDLTLRIPKYSVTLVVIG